MPAAILGSGFPGKIVPAFAFLGILFLIFVLYLRAGRSSSALAILKNDKILKIALIFAILAIDIP
jgi:hypothetical protein